MTLLPSVLAKLSEFPAFLDSAIYQVNGLLIVFTALGGLWLSMEVIGFIFKQRDARLTKAKAAAAHAQAAASTAPATGAAPAASSSAAAPDAMSPAIVAAVTAAVHVALAGRRHRVLAVNPASHDHAWAVEGRREIFGSHKVR